VSVHKTRSGGYEVRWREGTRQRSRSFDRKLDAERFDSEARRISQLGGVVPSRLGGVMLGAFAEEWFQRKRGLAPKTRREYAAQFDRHIDPYLGHIPLTQLGPRMLDEWQHERLASGAGPESIAKASKLLSQILDRAEALELILRNPARTLQRPGHVVRLPRAASAGQVEAIRGRLIEDGRVGDAALVSFLAYVGTRPMEALALSWNDVHEGQALIAKALTDGQVKETKTGRNRTVVVPKAVAGDLREWHLASGRTGGLVWPRRKDGLPWKQHDWDRWRTRVFKPTVRAVGLAELVPYDLRHTAASLLAAAGRPALEIAEQQGNSVAVSTAVYQHLITEYRGRSVRSLDELIAEARGEARRRTA
jgi:integrase